MNERDPTVELFGLSFFGGTAADLLAEVARMSSAGPRQVVTANVEHVITLAENEEFRNAYANAAVRTLDGMPLVLLSRLRGSPHAQRVTGHDILDAVLSGASPGAHRVFMVCASAATGEAVTRRLAACGIPRECIAYAVPPFGFEKDSALSASLAAQIRRHGATLLIMGVGAPKSEIWVHRQGEALGNPVVLNIGEALNVAAGLVPRAPRWVQAIALEWLFRFGTSPRRLFRRYFIRSWRFLGLVLMNPDLDRRRAGPVVQGRSVA